MEPTSNPSSNSLLSHESVKLLNFLFSNCPDDIGNICLRYKHPQEENAHNQFIGINHTEQIPDIITRRPNVNWWYETALCNGNDATKNGIYLIPALHLDHDNLTPQLQNEIHSFLKPSAVIQSSSETRQQFLWLLKEPAEAKDMAKVEDINLRLIERFGGDSGTQDASRLLRIPGTINVKYSDHPKCKILELNPDCQYSLEDFEVLPKPEISLAEYDSHANLERLQKIMQCAFLQHCDRNRAILSEPEWYGMICVLAKETGGVALIHSLSKGYPKYNRNETDRKIIHSNDSGPTTCARIKQLYDCGKDCGIKSPILLANSEKEITKEPTEEIHLTDLGNAVRFARLHGHEARYSFPQSLWYWYDGKRWGPDKTGKLYEMGQDLIKELLREASNEPDKDRRMRLENHALKCESDSKIEAMLRVARSKLSILPEAFDRDPWLFNCQNGTINLLDGTLHPHDRNDFISKISPVEYDSNATCPAWTEHLNKIMGGNQALIGFLQRFFGYCLTGSIDERCMSIFHGSGANGKTVTIETIAYVLGDYARRTRTETILVKKENSVGNDIADLVGSRFVYSSEAEQDKRLAESLVKDLTGGDSLSVRKLYQEYFTFKPQFKIALSTNHRPVILGVDQAIWDRIKLVPFSVTIPEDKRKPIHEMMGMFQDEAPGILAWMVRGCLEWLEKGLQTPDEVRAATKQYRSDMDVLQEFLDDCCNEDSSSTVSSRDLYNRFKLWGETEGLREREIWSKSTLTRRLKERGYIQSRAAERTWKGISLKVSGCTS